MFKFLKSVPRRLTLALTLTLLPVLALAAGSASTSKEPNVNAKPTTIGRTVSDDLQLASSLARYGRAKKSATALVLAAEILQTVGARPRTFKKTSVKDSKEPAGKKKKGHNSDLSVVGLAKEAAAMAKKSRSLKSRIQALSKRSATRGRADGPGRSHTSVEGHSTDTFSILFEGRRRAFVSVSGDGDTDLDCYVYDHHGHLVDSDQDGTDECRLEWWPRSTGSFTVRVRNRGHVYNHYTMHTN